MKFSLAKQRSGFGPLCACDNRFSLAYTLSLELKNCGHAPTPLNVVGSVPQPTHLKPLSYVWTISHQTNFLTVTF